MLGGAVLVGGRLTEPNLIGELVVHLAVRFLRECELRHFLKGLLDVDGFLSACFKVGNVAFCLTPCLCTFL